MGGFGLAFAAVWVKWYYNKEKGKPQKVFSKLGIPTERYPIIMTVAHHYPFEMLASIRRKIGALGSDRECTGALGTHRGSIRQIAFSHCGGLAATASGDNTVALWDLILRTRRATLGSVPENLTGGGVGSGHRHIVTCVCFSNDSRHVASGSYDKTLRVWSVEGGSALAIFHGHMQIITSVQFQPSSSALLSSSVDSTVRLWRLSQSGDEDWGRFPWGNGVTLEFAFAHTQASFLSDDHKDSEDFHRRTNRQRRHIPEMKCELSTLACAGPIVAALFSQDGSRIVAGSSDGSIRVWDAAKVTPPLLAEALILCVPGPGARIESLALASSRGLVAVGCVDASVHIYDLGSGAHFGQFRGLKGFPAALSFCHEHEDFVLACCGSPRIELLHIPTTKSVGSMTVVGSGLSGFCLDHDQSLMLCATASHTVVLVTDVRARLRAAVAAADANVGCFPKVAALTGAGDDDDEQRLLGVAGFAAEREGGQGEKSDSRDRHTAGRQRGAGCGKQRASCRADAWSVAGVAAGDASPKPEDLVAHGRAQACRSPREPVPCQKDDMRQALLAGVGGGGLTVAL